MERRKVLILAAPVGIALGAAFWIAAGDGGERAVAANEARLAALPHLRPAAARGRVDTIAAQGLLAAPLFDQAGPVREIAIRVEGIARLPGRAAALLSIDGAPAQWLNVGQSLAGLTLVSLSSSGVVVDTRDGGREVSLGAGAGSAPPTATASTPTSPSPVSGPPAGFRSPPPPASAPGGVP